jgi:hypothetical protein
MAGGMNPAEPGLAAERDRLARALRETRLQLTMTQARLAALEQSVTMELGRTLVRAAKRPWPRGARLPRDLVRLWRERGGAAPGPGAATLALASAQLSDLAGGGDRLLSSLTFPGLDPPGLVVTGVLTERACATLAPDAAVHPLLPHDADLMLDGSGADLVLIEAAAVLAGSAWAYACDPAAADRGRRLGRLIAAARALGKPVIFVRNVPAHLAPGLDWVAASCDAVAEGGFGVQLARFNPIGPGGPRLDVPVYAGPRDPREPPAVRALLDGLAGSVTFAGEVPWRREPALYREHAVFVTARADQAREQLACGARVVMIGGDPAAGADAAPAGLVAGAEAASTGPELRDRLAEARAGRAGGPLSGTGVLPALREIFAGHATAARLAALAALAGLPDRVVTGRQLAVLARVDGADEAAALSGSLRRQRLLPAEVVAVTDPAVLACHAVAAALGELADLGVTIRVVPGSPARWLERAAGAARSPWVTPWPAGREPGEHHLLDLACARECSRADAVGYAGAGYAFTGSLTPVLARPEFFGPDGPAAGPRLFSIGEIG